MASIVDAVRIQRGARRKVAQLLLLFPVAALLLLVLLAVAFVAYVLWPRWPAQKALANAPELPIVVGDVTFDVPAAAIRVPVQRRAGMQDRLDLVFLWPSLEPPGGAKPEPPAAKAVALQPIDRIFITVAKADGALPPSERLKTIYPRYIANEPDPSAAGLIAYRFRAGSPYQGEDLIYNKDDPQRFFLRCTTDGPAHVPGICLSERRMRKADITVRFPRDWLSDWRPVADGIERAIDRLKPH